MNISLLLAHPNPASFNHAIADAAADELRRRGHIVHVHDLHQERFDPITPAAECAAGATLPPVIAAHCAEIAAADGIVVVHPNWWGQPPAVLKGWIDRVLRPGLAYTFVRGDKGEGIPVGLLKARAAVVFNTANTPAEREDAVFGDPLDGLWRKCVFDLCGVKRVQREVFRVVVMSTPEQRAAWLARVRELVAQEFS